MAVGIVMLLGGWSTTSVHTVLSQQCIKYSTVQDDNPIYYVMTLS